MHEDTSTFALIRRTAGIRITTRARGISMFGMLGVLFAPGSRQPALVAPAPRPVAVVDSAPSLPARRITLLDSVRAESLLEPAAVRRPLEQYFARFSTDRVLVRRISRAVLREARRQQVPPSLIAAVLVTENTTLTPAAESSVGAQGLMQVMPMHAGARLCASDNLVDVDSNICHGTLILARNLRATRTPTAALLRYNGCVRGTNTPDCHRYPARVLTRAGLVRHEILASTNAMAMLD